MKKFYAILIAAFAFVSLQTKAQIACDASFTAQFLSGSTVKFNPMPSTLDSVSVHHFWSFGEVGGGYFNYSYSVSPINTFPTGTFSVGHRIYRTNPNGGAVCTDSTNQIITITQGACLLSASYVRYIDPSNILQRYYYNQTNNLSATDSIRWTFGDGTSANSYNATHTFANPGVYNVCLRVIKRNANGTLSNCVSEICRLDTVAYQCNIQAYFTSSSDSATAPATIQFNNQTVNYSPTDSITWNFGDGSAVSHAVNPFHIYTTAGTYTVCMRVKRNTTVAGAPPCVSEYCRQITITGPPCNLVANFTWYRDSIITIPNSYRFTNTTIPLSSSDSIRWTFGDGTSSNQVNPTHVYTTPGIYTVCLRVQKRNPNGILSNCISEKCYQILVAAITSPCNIQAYFLSLADSTQPNIIHFTNQSPGYLPTDSVFWNFGDGSPILSGVNNPTHTYTVAGVYTVCIKIKRNTPAGTVPCIREYCKVVSITIPCNLVTNFTWYRDSLPTAAPNTYHFVNTSAPISSTDSIRWTFGDGTSSNQVNPTHVYAQAGTYTVCLRVQKRNANGNLTTCIKEKCYTIVVPQTCTLQSNFTSAATTANYKTIVFTNTTIVSGSGATALWSFGDGTSATTWNATHTYAQAGRYAVCLRTQIGTCISYKCDSITIIAPIPVPNCIELSKFSFATYGNGQAGFAVYNPQNNVQYTWTFGDGTGVQNGILVSHTYAAPGYYTACLTAFRDSSCASTSCRSIYIGPFCNNITLAINDVRDSLVPNRIKFTALSNTATTNQVWTITKIPTTATTGTVTINANNPTYMFLDSGYYNVCVKATFANGCVKTICKIIYVAQNMPVVNNCTLQIYPNPASSIINANITLVQPLLLNAYVYNSMNVLVAQKQQQGIVGNNTVSINIANLPAGIYILRLVYGNQLCYATFIKQ